MYRSHGHYWLTHIYILNEFEKKINMIKSFKCAKILFPWWSREGRSPSTPLNSNLATTVQHFTYNLIYEEDKQARKLYPRGCIYFKGKLKDKEGLLTIDYRLFQNFLLQIINWIFYPDLTIYIPLKMLPRNVISKLPPLLEKYLFSNLDSNSLQTRHFTWSNERKQTKMNH